MNRLFLFLLLFLPAIASAKDYEVKIHVRNLPESNRPLLLRIYNGNTYIVDSMAMRDNDHQTISFRIPETMNAGMMQAILGLSTYAKYTNGEPTFVNFLFNKEDIELALDFEKPETTFEVIQSKENKLYFDFLEKDALWLRKLVSLEQVAVNYPDKDDFYQKALEYYRKFQIQRDKFIDEYSSKNRNTLAGRIIATKKMPFTEGNITGAQRDSVYREDFLKKTGFNDTTLLYTNVYTDKVYQYVNMFVPRTASMREMEAGIIRALDKLVPQLGSNTVVQQHLMQFLISGFEESKLEEVLAHISANYMQQCGGTEDIVKRRLEGYQKMAVGKNVPDFTVMDISNNPVNLYGSVSPYTLLIFWHTECNHCKVLMQELQELVKKDFFQKHNVKIIGISIDDDRKAWESFSADRPMNWINTHVDGGFNSKIATDYNLFATPSMFLLDDTNTIIAKPTTIEELRTNVSGL